MKNLLKKELTILEGIADVYLFTMILIFPLLVDKTGFFHILECKWYSYVTITGIYLLVNLFVILYFLLFKKVNCFKKKKFSVVQGLAVAFLVINFLSAFLSPYFQKYNLWIGVGRGEGLLAMSLYTLSFLCLSFFLKFKKRYLAYFSISSILLSGVAILQYIGFNPFYLYQGGIGTHNVSFMSTIGNIDFLSAMYCMLLAISFSAYVFLEKNEVWEKVLHLLSLFFVFFIVGIIDVQSGKVALLGTLILIFPFIIANHQRLSRFLVVLAMIFMAYGINIVLNPEYHYDVHRLGFYFQFNYFVVAFIIICIAFLYLAHILQKCEYDFLQNKKIIKGFYLGMVACALVAFLILYFGNFQSGIFYEIHGLLHGECNDQFGNYRIFLWKRTFPLVWEYPLLGSGPDTFAIRFMAKYSADVAAIGPLTINDTAANVYFTMLVNIGILGFMSYVGFLFFQFKRGIQNMNSYSFVFMIALLCYMIQDFFNLSLVIVTPIFWILMALHLQSLSSFS